MMQLPCDRPAMRLPGLLDDSVCANENRTGHFQIEQPGSLQIHDQFEFGGLLDCKFRGLGALQDFVEVHCGPLRKCVEVRSVTHEAACRRPWPPPAYQRYALSICEAE